MDAIWRRELDQVGIAKKPQHTAQVRIRVALLQHHPTHKLGLYTVDLLLIHLIMICHNWQAESSLSIVFNKLRQALIFMANMVDQHARL